MIAPTSACRITSRSVRDPYQGWWWGVWQDGVLVGFGAGYRHKGRCLRRERDCVKSAKAQALPAVECTNRLICPFK